METLQESFVGFVDETIRDGLQTPYCPSLTVEEKLTFVDCMYNVKGISDVIIGMAGLGEKNRNELQQILKHCLELKTRLMPWILCRSFESDIHEVYQLMEETGCRLGINLFMCFSDIRIFVEGWDFENIHSSLLRNVELCKKKFSFIRVALEDATRTKKEVLGKVVYSLVGMEADRIAIADTAGIATPVGVQRIFDYIYNVCSGSGKNKTAFEWHGHNDRGLAVANSLQSIISGANYVHGTMIGIGERNGNAALDTIMMNLSEQLDKRVNWKAVYEYYDICDKLFKDVIQGSYPYFGQNSYTSSTGTHCAAIKKAMDIGRTDISRNLFSPPSRLSKYTDFTFLISHLSGKKNIEEALKQMGVSFDEKLLSHISQYAKQCSRTLGKEDIMYIINSGV